MSDEAATQPGATSERSNLIEAIAAANQEIIEGDQSAPPPVDVEGDQSAEAPEDQPAELAEDDQSDAEQQPAEPETIGLDETVTLKVDGQEQTATIKELIEFGKRARQKDLAADRRLEEATRLLKEAREQSTTRQQPDEQKKDEVKQPLDAKLIEAIQYGDTQAASEALQKLIGSRGSKAGDDERIAQLAQSQVMQALQARDIQSRFKEAFPGVLDDAILAKAAAEKVNELLESGEANSWETYEQAGQYVTEWLQTKAVRKDGMADRQERKRNITQISAANAKKQAVTDDKPESAQEIILSMQRQRQRL